MDEQVVSNLTSTVTGWASTISTNVVTVMLAFGGIVGLFLLFRYIFRAAKAAK